MLVVLVTGALFLGLAVGPHLLGYRTLVMRTSSMQPTVAPGDVLVISGEPASALRAGQMLTFAAPIAGSPVVTHRVVSVQRRDGDTVVQTKGDANSGPDPWRARLTGDTAWHVVAVIPLLGWGIAALHHPVVHLVSVWMIPAALCLEVLLRLWRRPRAEVPSAPQVAGAET